LTTILSFFVSGWNQSGSLGVCLPIVIFISGQAFLSVFIALSSSVAACSRFLPMAKLKIKN
jgi:hypothetical protein